MTVLDCTMCGACCCNSNENRADAYVWYVAIEDEDSPLLTQKKWRRVVAFDPEGTPHLRLNPDGRCAALTGRLGQRVHCEVYKYRPSGCRGVEPGDRNCLRARRERGIDP